MTASVCIKHIFEKMVMIFRFVLCVCEKDAHRTVWNSLKPLAAQGLFIHSARALHWIGNISGGRFIWSKNVWKICHFDTKTNRFLSARLKKLRLFCRSIFSGPISGYYRLTGNNNFGNVVILMLESMLPFQFLFQAAAISKIDISRIHFQSKNIIFNDSLWIYWTIATIFKMGVLWPNL